MLVIVGLIVLFVAAIVAIVGVLTNAGAAHPLTDNFSVFGYHVTESTGTLVLCGIVVGAVALLGLSVLLAGARRTAGRAHDARREVARLQRETAFIDRERTARLGRRQRDDGATQQHGGPLLGRWSRSRRPIGVEESTSTKAVS